MGSQGENGLNAVKLQVQKNHNPHWELTPVKGIRGQHETKKNLLIHSCNLQIRPGELKGYIVGSSVVSILLVFPLKVVGTARLILVKGADVR